MYHLTEYSKLIEAHKIIVYYGKYPKSPKCLIVMRRDGSRIEEFPQPEELIQVDFVIFSIEFRLPWLRLTRDKAQKVS